MRSTFRPTTAECNIGNRTTAELDKFCANTDKCVEWAKKTLQDGCKEEASLPRVKFTIEFGISMNYKGKCLKDSKNEYCKIRRNETSQCNDCHPKFRDMMTTVLASAPQETKDKMFGWHDKRNPCNGTEKDKPMPHRGAGEARDTNSNNKNQGTGTNQNVSSDSPSLSASNALFYLSALVSTVYAVNTFLY
jgi:hypothetical protein